MRCLFLCLALGSCVTPSDPPSFFKVATEDDKALVFEWLNGFDDKLQKCNSDFGDGQPNVFAFEIRVGKKHLVEQCRVVTAIRSYVKNNDCMCDVYLEKPFPVRRYGPVVVGTEKFTYRLTEQVIVMGGLSSKEVKQKVHENSKPIRHCYEQALKKDQKFAIDLWLYWNINAEGRVEDAKIVKIHGDERNLRFHGCVLGRLKKMKFPKPEDRQRVHVVLPLKFNPLKQALKKTSP